MNSETIDITDCRLTGNALKREILERVKDTQRLLIRTLPNRIIMTKKQFKELSADPQMIDVGTSEERIYMTRMNAMDVIVQ